MTIVNTNIKCPLSPAEIGGCAVTMAGKCRERKYSATLL